MSADMVSVTFKMPEAIHQQVMGFVRTKPDVTSRTAGLNRLIVRGLKGETDDDENAALLAEALRAGLEVHAVAEGAA